MLSRSARHPKEGRATVTVETVTAYYSPVQPNLPKRHPRSLSPLRKPNQKWIRRLPRRRQRIPPKPSPRNPRSRPARRTFLRLHHRQHPQVPLKDFKIPKKRQPPSATAPATGVTSHYYVTRSVQQCPSRDFFQETIQVSRGADPYLPEEIHLNQELC